MMDSLQRTARVNPFQLAVDAVFLVWRHHGRAGLARIFTRLPDGPASSYGLRVALARALMVLAVWPRLRAALVRGLPALQAWSA